MKNFVLIDHSVKRIGGHNYEYAFHILSAAERAGYSPILAANRRFFERRRLPSSWQLYTPFRHTTYEVTKLAAKQRRFDPEGALLESRTPNLETASHSRARTTWAAALPASLRRHFVARYERSKQRIVEHFTEDLERLFEQMRLEPHDHVFVPTLSQDDLVGLLEFYRRNVQRAGVWDWHLQFHFKIYEGREPGYDAQEERLVRLRQLFRDTAAALPSDRVHFYTTTDILAAQYNRLGAAEFHALPYPVNPALLEKQATSSRIDGPLRVTCAGGVRPEKGTAQLFRAIAPLWRDYFESGRLQLVVQAKRLGKLPPELRPYASWRGTDKHAWFRSGGTDRWGGTDPPRRVSGAGQPGPQSRALRWRGEKRSEVSVVRWPLSTEKYLDLIRDSHIALLMYDAEPYYARCSGVLVEMLKAGVPVIVPAGCWMAEQLAEPIYAHRDRICAALPQTARIMAAAAEWETSSGTRLRLSTGDTRLVLARDGNSLVARLPAAHGASHLCIRFHWAAGTRPGNYLELVATQTPDGKRQLATTREIFGSRLGKRPLSMLIPLVPDARRVQIVWRNAFDAGMLAIENVEFLFLSAGQTACPLGAVGLIAAGIDQTAVLLQDIADNYAHYRRTAEEFAPAWGRWHSPEQVVGLLTGSGSNDCAIDRRSAA